MFPYGEHRRNRMGPRAADQFPIGGLATEDSVEVLKAGKELAWLALANLKPKTFTKTQSEKGVGSTRALAHSIKNRMLWPEWFRGAAGKDSSVLTAGKRQPWTPV